MHKYPKVWPEIRSAFCSCIKKVFARVFFSVQDISPFLRGSNVTTEDSASVSINHSESYKRSTCNFGSTPGTFTRSTCNLQSSFFASTFFASHLDSAHNGHTGWVWCVWASLVECLQHVSLWILGLVLLHSHGMGRSQRVLDDANCRSCTVVRFYSQSAKLLPCSFNVHLSSQTKAGLYAQRLGSVWKSYDFFTHKRNCLFITRNRIVSLQKQFSSASHWTVIKDLWSY